MVIIRETIVTLSRIKGRDRRRVSATAVEIRNHVIQMGINIRMSWSDSMTRVVLGVRCVSSQMLSGWRDYSAMRGAGMGTRIGLRRDRRARRA
jgi:hypothetical protein